MDKTEQIRLAKIARETFITNAEITDRRPFEELAAWQQQAWLKTIDAIVAPLSAELAIAKAEADQFALENERIDQLEIERDVLKAQLTSAKEENDALAREFQKLSDKLHCYSQDNKHAEVNKLIGRAEAAESLLSAERKETERLKGLMRDALNPTTLGVSHLDIEDCKCWNCCQKRLQAALQERQGEE